MTETEHETIAERLDALQQRAETELRSNTIGDIVRDLVALMREIAEAKTGTLTPAELEAALGGAAFLGSLGAMLDRIDRAKAQDVERVIDHIFAGRPAATRNGDAA